MKQGYHITFDIDWAPDSSIELCLDLLRERNIKATFFATHETDMNREIELRGHELGVHPNFLPNSTHGSEFKEVIDTCLSYAPNARYMRTHALVQSSPMLYEIFSSFPQLTVDISIFMHRARYVQRCEWSYDGVSFDRLNYNWEDDAEFDNNDFDYTAAQFFGPVTIYDFHPIHVHLNSRDNSNYRKLKENLNGLPLSDVTDGVVSRFVNPEGGTRSFLESILDSDAESMSLEVIK